MQAVDMFLNEKELENALLVLWGREVDNGEVRKTIMESRLRGNVILGGFNDQMDIFWKFCDVNLFLSLNDGFGLSIIEGYTHGVPCVTFKDLDATQDLYFSEAMIAVKERDNKVVVQELLKAIEKEWNRENIIEIGNLFSLEKMARKYVDWYKSVINA